jgi:hypothetical protein
LADAAFNRLSRVVNLGRKRETKMTTENEMTPTEEMIAARAYERYVQRGREDGHDVEDWLAAEGELRAELSGQAGAETAPALRTRNAQTAQSAAAAAPS